MSFENVTCANCGEVLEREVIRDSIKVGERPIIVEDFCTSCGERGLSTREYIEQDLKNK